MAVSTPTAQVVVASPRQATQSAPSPTAAMVAQATVTATSQHVAPTAPAVSSSHVPGHARCAATGHFSRLQSGSMRRQRSLGPVQDRRLAQASCAAATLAARRLDPAPGPAAATMVITLTAWRATCCSVSPAAATVRCCRAYLPGHAAAGRPTLTPSPAADTMVATRAALQMTATHRAMMGMPEAPGRACVRRSPAGHPASSGPTQ